MSFRAASSNDGARPGARADSFIQELYDLFEEEERLDVVGVHNNSEFEITDLDVEPVRRPPDQREFKS